MHYSIVVLKDIYISFMDFVNHNVVAYTLELFSKSHDVLLHCVACCFVVSNLYFDDFVSI